MSHHALPAATPCQLAACQVLYVWLLLLLALAPTTLASDVCIPQSAIELRLPSESTGVAGGTLAVRLFAPSAGSGRFAAGAPVIVACQGGTAAGDLKNPFPPALDDVIIVTFLYPGGRQGGLSSDGVYDDRGERCIQAARDVLLFAGGRLSDQAGRTIARISPVPVRTGNVGAIGLSNGGNMVAAVASRYGRELEGILRYIVQWESPVSSQMATVDLGGYKLIDGQQHAVPFDAVNPRYLSYGRLEATVYTTDIRYNQSSPVTVFHDGNRDGIYTTVLNPATGKNLPDLDFDGVLELDEDFPLGAYTSAGRSVYSRPVTRALETNGAFQGGWPAQILDPEEADAFWDLREAVRLADQAATGLPTLEAMIVAGVRDHVQGRPDKPHVRQAFESWDRQGLWVQINPDRAYMEEILPALSGRDDLPQNAPNTPPNDWGRPIGWCYPEDISSGVVNAAAVRQMADRVESSGGWTWVHQTCLPFIAAGYGWETILEAGNTTGTEQAIQVIGYDLTGESTLIRSIPSHSCSRIKIEAGRCAHVYASSTGLTLTAVYLYAPNQTRVAVPLPKRVTTETTLLAPVQATPVWSGIGLMNAGTVENRIRLDAIGGDGWILDSLTLTLPAHYGFSAMFDTLFEISPAMVSQLRITGTEALSGMAIHGLADGSISGSVPLPAPDSLTIGLPVPTSGFSGNQLVFDNPHLTEVSASVIPFFSGVAGAPIEVAVPPGNRTFLELQQVNAKAEEMDGLAIRFGEKAAFVRLTDSASGSNRELLLTGRTSHRLVLSLGEAPRHSKPVLLNTTGITQRIRLTAMTDDGQAWTAELKLAPRSQLRLDPATIFPALPPDPDIRLMIAGQGGLSAIMEQDEDPASWESADVIPQTPAYLTFFSHNEDSWQSMVSSPQGYLAYREDLLERLNLMAEAGVVMDWQSDWAVLDAMVHFENETLLDTTNGKNIVRYMVENLNFSADPHGHLVQYNYADIAHLFRQLGLEPAPVIGGARWTECGTGGELLAPIDWREDAEVGVDGIVRGRVFPEAVWRPEILSVPAFAGHWFDEMSSGVWKPGILEDFYLHDSGRDIVYVGQGDPHDATLLGTEHASHSGVFEEQGSYVCELVNKVRSGEIPDGRMHTASLHIRDKQVPDTGGARTNDRLAGMLDILAPYLDSGEIVSVTYPEAARLWQDLFGSKPGRTPIENFSRFGEKESQIKSHCGATVPTVLFSVNVHDWVLPSDSARTVGRILDIHEKYEVPVDIYLTDPIVQAYLRETPELLERLRTSPQAVVSYHLRPPAPYYWNFDFLGLADLPGPELAALLAEYETHALDLTSGTPGESPGGYDCLARVMGYAPLVVSGFSQAGPVGETLLDLYHDMGAGLFVVHGRVIEPGEAAGPLFIRPEHVEMKLYEHPEREAAAWIRQELEPWRGEEPVYVNIKVHENNFYLWGTSWDPVFFGSDGLLEPPFDLSAWEGTLSYRSEAAQAAQWASYEAAVGFIGANRYSYHPTDCREVLELLQSSRP